MHQNFKYVLSLLLFISGTTFLWAQPQLNSPYSRYGLGNLENSNFAPLGAMGNVHTTYNSIYHLNPSNPASYATLNYTAFETGVFGRFAQLKTPIDTFNANSSSGNLSYIALGFPVFNPINRLTIKKDYPFDWGMALGLIPYSNVGYDIETTSESPDFGEVVYRNQGYGQLYKLFYGNGFHYNNISFGFNANYLFGRVRNDKTVIFNDLPLSLVDELRDESNTQGFLLDLGAQYRLRVDKKEEDKEKDRRKDKTYVTFGATFTPGMKATTKAHKLYLSRNFSDGAVYIDTIQNVVNRKDKMQMPTTFSFGLGLAKSSKWKIGVNYETTTWNTFSSPNHLDDLKLSYKVGFGAEITPDVEAYEAYQKRVSYRFGAFYQSDPRVVGNEQLTNYGITFGFGLPIIIPGGNKMTHVNMGIELGRIGTPDIIQENYLRATLAFTLNDNTWFYKRKYK